MNQIVVHHLENSRSQRVLWLLEELGLPYEVKRYERDRQTMLAPPELRAVHPLGKSPVITDGDTTVAESGAIVEYLVAKAGALRPATGTPAALQFTYWLHFAEGTAMPPLVMKLVFDKIQQAKLPFFVKPIAKGIAQKVLSSFVLPNIGAQLKFMNETLARQPWFAGDSFSAADVQMSFPLEAAAARGGLDTRHPHLQAWLATVHARPAYQRALQAGGPYDILG
jgi:glutathione S-transferase